MEMWRIMATTIHILQYKCLWRLLFFVRSGDTWISIAIIRIIGRNQSQQTNAGSRRQRPNLGHDESHQEAPQECEPSSRARWLWPSTTFFQSGWDRGCRAEDKVGQLQISPEPLERLAHDEHADYPLWRYRPYVMSAAGFPSDMVTVQVLHLDFTFI